MRSGVSETIDLVVIVTPYFNLAATTAFIDPFRAANYLTGENRFRWHLLSGTGGEVPASNGLSVTTTPIAEGIGARPDFVVVSSSWTPEDHHSVALSRALKAWSHEGARLGALDTGGFLLARAGLLNGRRATVHYEHIDAFIELYPDVTVTEDLYVVDGGVFTCAGGVASVDLALSILGELMGEGLANAVARYLFHHRVRGPDASQNPGNPEPYGRVTPRLVRRAIDQMEAHLEEPLPIPEICARLEVSPRHLSRLFRQYVHKSPVLYYRDIRLDRARGLVTQTEMKMSEIAVACGFSSQVHFSRAYRERFGMPPSSDRIEGRVPFEFRAWPMHSPTAR